MDGIESTEIETLETGHTLKRTPTHHIRWLDTEDKTGRSIVLQRLWEELRFDSNGMVIGLRSEWRLVPTVKVKT